MPEESSLPPVVAPFPARDISSSAALSHRFNYHPPKNDQRERYEAIRANLRDCAVFCCARTPKSPEQTRALNALDEAMFLFNASIARNE